jgi:hypothetical protein
MDSEAFLFSLVHVHNYELFAAVGNSGDEYVSGSLRGKDLESVFLQVLGFYFMYKNIQVLQF